MIDKSNKEVFTPTFIDDCQEDNVCTKCNYKFTVGESFLIHYINHHIEYIFNLLSAGEKTLVLQHDKTPDPYDLERQRSKRDGFAPRCKNCNHDNPDYTVVSKRPHPDGIKLKCIYCGDISVKD